MRGPSAATGLLEFCWAGRLRNKPVIDLAKVDTAACTAAIKTASQAMAALKATDIVSGTATARSPGWSGVFSQAALDDLITPPGKLT